MAEDLDSPISGPTSEQPPPWSQVWQLPVLILGITLLTVGLVLTSRNKGETEDFPGKLDEIAQYLTANNLEKAKEEVTFLADRIGRAAQMDRARFEMYRGDLTCKEQHASNEDLKQSHEWIHSRYLQSAELGQHFDALHLQRWAKTLVALGREDQALAKVDQITNGPAERRYMVVKEIIQRRRHLMAGDESHQMVPLIERFVKELEEETDTNRRRKERVWAAGLRAQGLLDAGDSQRAIGYLQKQIARFLDEDGSTTLSELTVLMGKAHQKMGDFAESERWYLQAQQNLLPADPINAQVLVGLGELALAQSDAVRTAIDHFTEAEVNYPSTPAYVSALIGRADCEARLGNDPDALERFDLALTQLLNDPFRSQNQVDKFVNFVRNHHDLNYDRQDFALALEYLQLLRPLHETEMPTDLLAEFAVTHERIAEQKNAKAMSGSNGEAPEGGMPDSTSTASQRLAFQEAAVQFEKSAEFYLRHARVVTISNDDVFGASLWQAATNYDKAQQWQKAIQVYAEFVKVRPTDPRQLEAMNHLAMAYQADTQYEAAAGLFEQLISEHPKSPEAYASLVPLARCRVALDRDEDAVRVLLNVLTDHPSIRPDSQPYREAMVELSKLFYRQQRFEEAIERLSEAIERYGNSADGATLRFMLADTYRQSIEQIDKAVSEPLAQTKRLSHQDERARRLEQAQIYYNEVISLLETRDASTFSPADLLFYRNAYFYRADCAYDLGRFEQSISLYDLAAKRWEHHPASMVALIQIVNAYCELGRIREARVANDRARWQLNRIPDEEFDDPSLPMDRHHWQDWLRWASELKLFEPLPNTG